MTDAQVEHVLANARAFAAADAGNVQDAAVIASLPFCTLARIAYQVLSEYAKSAPFTYAWALRTVAGQLRKWSAGRCG